MGQIQRLGRGLTRRMRRAAGVVSAPLARSRLFTGARCATVLSTGRAGSTTLCALLALSRDIAACDEPAPQPLAERKRAYASIAESIAPFAATFTGYRALPVMCAHARGKLYAETSCRWTYLTPAIARVLPQSRFIHLHRHPADFVRAAYERGWYTSHRNDRFRILPRPDDPAYDLWPHWDSFRKVCWNWQACHRFATAFKRTLSGDRVLTIRSEELFDVQSGVHARLFGFLGVEPPPESAIAAVLRARRDSSSHEGTATPPLSEWSTEWRQALLEIAGETMAELGYELEPDTRASRCGSVRTRPRNPATANGIVVMQRDRASQNGKSPDELTPPPQPEARGSNRLVITLSAPTRPRSEAAESIVTNCAGLPLAHVPAGRFRMGSRHTVEELRQLYPYVDPFWFHGEHPAHEVVIERSFRIGTHEVTRGQFREFVRATGYRTQAEVDRRGGTGWTGTQFVQDRRFNWRETGVPQSDDEPVGNVSWNDAVAYCRWLSEVEGVSYRLPTEAEWEYACRAGSDALYCNGDVPECLQHVGNCADATGREKFHWRTRGLESSNGFEFAAPVGSFAPNAWGLYDMHGNMAEWCADWFSHDYYRHSPASSPAGPTAGSARVVRGGSWRDSPFRCRSAYRDGRRPTDRGNALGFRVVREL